MNAIIFYVVRKEKDTRYRIEEEARQATKGVKFSNDQKAFVLWSLQNKVEDRSSEVVGTSGSLMVYRVAETSSEQVAHMTKEVADFNLQVALKENEKYEARPCKLGLIRFWKPILPGERRLKRKTG